MIRYVIQWFQSQESSSWCLCDLLLFVQIDRHVRLLDQAIKEHEIHWKGDLSSVQINSPTFPISGLLITRMKDNGEGLMDVTIRTDPQKGTEKISRSRSGTRSRKGIKRRSLSIVEPNSSDNIFNEDDDGGGGGKAKGCLFHVPLMCHMFPWPFFRTVFPANPI